MSVETLTLGCRLNFAESETMKGLAPEGSLVINSCAVTAEAVAKTRRAIRRAHREAPDRPIFVTGCAAELEPDTFATMPEVARVIGNADKLLPQSFSSKDKVIRSDVMASRTPQLASGFRSRVRSFVAIQTGCDHRCTFCTIWTARGNSLSFPYADVREAVEKELAAGAAEIVLTGVDITSYADDRAGSGLGRLCQRLLSDLPRLKRLRLSSLDSIEVDDALMELVAGEERLLPHFHLSLQAGDDLILKRMKRRHLRADAIAIIEKLKARRSGVTIGADLIAGFPTESEEAAANTRALIADADIIAAHIFPFSPRPGTPAARMPQLDPALIKERAARLRDVAASHRAKWLDSLVGTRQRVLIENKAEGHADNFAPVRIEGTTRGDKGMARIIAHQNDLLIGEFE